MKVDPRDALGSPLLQAHYDIVRLNELDTVMDTRATPM